MTTCSQCGGSGVLRLNDQRYRTCLECLGQGHHSGLPAAITTAALLTPERTNAPLTGLRVSSSPV